MQHRAFDIDCATPQVMALTDAEGREMDKEGRRSVALSNRMVIWCE